MGAVQLAQERKEKPTCNQKINLENNQNKISSNLAAANFLNKRKTLPM